MKPEIDESSACQREPDEVDDKVCESVYEEPAIRSTR
jgi:hypothetical protein